MHYSAAVSVVWQCKLVSGWVLRNREINAALWWLRLGKDFTCFTLHRCSTHHDTGWRRNCTHADKAENSIRSMQRLFVQANDDGACASVGHQRKRSAGILTYIDRGQIHIEQLDGKHEMKCTHLRSDDEFYGRLNATGARFVYIRVNHHWVLQVCREREREYYQAGRSFSGQSSILHFDGWPPTLTGNDRQLIWHFL